MKNDSLTNRELIQILIDDEVGIVSDSILNYTAGGLRSLDKLDYAALVAGLKLQENQAQKLIAGLELGRRVQFSIAENKLIANSSSSVFKFLRPVMSGLHHEEFHILYLNQGLKLIKHDILSAGGMTGTVVDVRVLFKKALILNACRIMVAHNHPSGRDMPSEADIELTKKIKEAGDFLNITLIDHLIVADTNYYSFADCGLL